jgi:hypothetical protein
MQTNQSLEIKSRQPIDSERKSELPELSGTQAFALFMECLWDFLRDVYVELRAFVVQIFQRPPAPDSPASSERQPGLVRRIPVAYWQERGWIWSFHRYIGYYRTSIGAWKGRAEVSPSGKVKLFISDPPEFLKKHPAWTCFLPRDSHWFVIHTHCSPDLSEGIMRVEQIIQEAFSKN